MKTVAVGLSGGVDSTLTALLLKEQGYHVIGLTMAIFEDKGSDIPPSRDACYGPSEKYDIEEIRQWALQNGIETHVLDLSKEYRKIVLGYFKENYLSGRTPNPCVMCNTQMKFGLLKDEAHRIGIKFDYFATGHYARIENVGERFILKTGIDQKKDQSYFLYRLTQEQLSTTLFPLGGLTKEIVRQMARERHLEAADKPDSQDFYAGDYVDLLEQKPRCGQIVHTSGKVLGLHQGFWNYTIGQRKGLGIAFKVPLFVVDINAAENKIIVGSTDETLSFECTASDCNWIGFTTTLGTPIPVMVKYRSSGQFVPARIIPQKDHVQVLFDAPQKSVARGQSIVFYNGDNVLGGGIIG